MIPDLVKIILPTVCAFILGIVATPFLTTFLYKHSMWKKKSVEKTISGEQATLSQKFHNDEERKTPRMGGIIVWGSVLAITIIFYILSLVLHYPFFEKLSFLSRNQTWFPLFTLLTTSFLGLVDDYLVCSDGGQYIGGGLSLKTRLLAVATVGLLGALWFYFKLDIHSIIIPFFGEYTLGLFFLPLYVVLMVGLYSGGIIDGIDGLAGGVLASEFAAFGVIAFYNNQIDIAAFTLTITGGLLAFLWFNIPPARFFLSETGTMGLTTTLVVIAFFTKAVPALLIICLPLIVTSASSVLQILSKKFRNGKKVFLVAPLHNHFQAYGWPAYKVTMRYWIISIICSIIGVVITVVG